MPEFPPPRSIELPARDAGGAITLAVHEMGGGPPVVFCHGFPELAYSWRHQLPAVAAAGFRAIAPDLRGYGASSRPEPIEAYGLSELTGDLVALLDRLEIEKAVFVGHDWGGLVTWAMPVLHAERTAGVAAVCTPYVPVPPIDFMRAMVGGDDERHYMVWFQQPGVAEAVLDAQVRAVFEKLMRGGVPLEQMMERALVDGKLDLNPFRRLAGIEPIGEPIAHVAELEVYIRTFEQTGFRGAINWYRNIDRNSREHPEVGTRPLTLPCLMIAAQWDPALPAALVHMMRPLCADLEVQMIERAGHWVQQEFPGQVNSHLVSWLTRRFR